RRRIVFMGDPFLRFMSGSLRGGTLSRREVRKICARKKRKGARPPEGKSGARVGRGRLLVHRRFAGRRTLMVMTARTAGAAAIRAGRHQFIHRQLAVAILVEGAQGRGRAVNFLRVDDAVVIGIEGGNDRRQRWTTAGAARAAGAAVLRRLLAAIVLG